MKCEVRIVTQDLHSMKWETGTGHPSLIHLSMIVLTKGNDFYDFLLWERQYSKNSPFFIKERTCFGRSKCVSLKPWPLLKGSQNKNGRVPSHDIVPIHIIGWFIVWDGTRCLSKYDLHLHKNVQCKDFSSKSYSHTVLQSK